MNNDQRQRMIEYLTEAAGHHHPTLYIVRDFVTGAAAPTSWNDVFVCLLMSNGSPYLQRIMFPAHMKKRRKDNNYYWHENSWGTSHNFLVVQKLEKAFGMDLSKFQTCIL